MASEPVVVSLSPKVAPKHLQSDQNERVTLVDRSDRVIGVGDKLDVHRVGQLHRAFSIVIFNEREEILLQRRADAKYHFAGLWSNACCGHPRPGEAVLAAAQRRLFEELGFNTPLRKHKELYYRAIDPISGLWEHEYLHLFCGRFSDQFEANPAEVGAWRWMSIAAVERALTRFPEQFTPWFKIFMRQRIIKLKPD